MNYESLNIHQRINAKGNNQSHAVNLSGYKPSELQQIKHQFDPHGLRPFDGIYEYKRN